MWLQLWSITTNLVGVLPIFQFFKRKYFVDGIYVSLTMLSSILYHTVMDKPKLLEDDILEPSAITNVDHMMADMLILMMPWWVLYRDKYHQRFGIYIFMVPFQTYAMYFGPSARFYLYLAYSIPPMTMIIYRHWKDRWLYSGLMLNILEIISYFVLAEKKDALHHFYHGMHHVFAFLSLLCYQKIKPLQANSSVTFL